MTDSALILRPATREDVGFLQSLLPRFISFGLPLGQDEGAVLAGATQNLLAALAAPQTDSALLIAWVEEEEKPPRRAGFLRLDTERPLFGKPFAYLADLALAEWAEGLGLGQILLNEAENWARAQGLKHIQLHVFATNVRARKLYERAGYSEATLGLVKVLKGKK
ncbi:GNAT family N-acetyltransferase [Deinococcus psychrotolerans]|uniref:GNAT family N-acetyltransferase n=1 Tax=Deinococcus psychrotolerans TaxID=2489213 RepID=A0A3G8YEP4_9DEIO|nr:GNAT family N-acetyltransferase [Deinococcus psychrotolerans]AZI43445.1 GNAT family N-acetyltransferase [Deinococcus psychrotolerans]